MVHSKIQYNGKDYLIYINDLQKSYSSTELSVAEFSALCSTSLDVSIKPGLAVIGEVSLTGTIKEIIGLEDYLRVAYNAGTKTLLLPIKSKEAFERIVESEGFNLEAIYYSNIIEAAKLALSSLKEEKEDEGFDI